MDATGVRLVERSLQLGQVESLLHAARNGRGALALIEGPPGIGKTAFLEAATALAQSLEMQVLAARAGELEQGFAFGVVHQLFERRLARAAPAERKRLLAGAASFAARVFAPSSAPTDSASPEALHATLHGLYWLTANLATAHPLVVAVDDAHWADAASLAFLVYLARRVDGLASLILIAARSPGGDERLAALSLGSRASISLPNLSEGAVGRLVESRFGAAADPRIAGACYAATNGNPFLVRALIDWLAAADDPAAAVLSGAAPPGVQTSVLYRLRRLSSGAQAVAKAAAVLDADATVSRTSALADLSLAETGVAADELLSAGLLGSARPFQFVHALVRGAVLANVPAAERSTLNLRAAQLLREESADVGIVARHLTDCDPVGESWVVDVLQRAAVKALAHADPGSAATWLRRCLDEPLAAEVRARILRELGLAEQRLGDARADLHLRQAFALTEDPIERAETLRALLLDLLPAGGRAEVVAMLDATLPELATRDPDLAQRLEAETLSAARHSVSTSLWAAHRLRSWRGRAQPDSAGGRLLLANLATQCALDGGCAEEAAQLATTALAGGHLVDEQAPDTMPVYQAIWQLIAAERLDVAEAALDLALQDTRRRGSVVGFALASLFHSYLELARGNLIAAEADVAAALEAAEPLGERWFGAPAAVAALADVCIQRGSLDTAATALLGHNWNGTLPDSVPFRLLLHSRGQLRLASGEPDAAAADFLEHLQREARLNVLASHLVPSRCGAALALASVGDVERASSFAAEAVREARAWGAPRTVAHALRARARLEARREAVATLQEAAEVLDRSPARVEEAEVRLDFGRALLRVNRRTSGAQELRRALDLAHRSGARRLAESARAELVAAGFRPRRAALSGAEALTGSERRVVELAARGLSNRDIAQQLFVTERTVEVHLTNAYRKLGVSSRRELTATAQLS
jgi:DNA-binding CsgD family transcriptional regulator